ncbi:MAG TPA: ATP-binding protein [Polyangiaceae bacterium]
MRSQIASTELQELSQRALADPVLGIVFEAIGGYAMVLDENRRIVAANADLLRMLNVQQGSSIVDLLPGDALECVNAKRWGKGCGGSLQCQHCGALLAMLAAKGAPTPVEGHCVLTRVVDASTPEAKSADFRIRISPLTLGGAPVHIVVMHDVTAIKWRELQERMFQHDLANMLSGLNGWSDELLQSPTAQAAAEVVTLVNRLTESLQTHRLIMQCEAGELQLTKTNVDIPWLTSSLQSWFAEHECARNRSFDVRRAADAQFVETDASILLRVLGNLIVNAFEACPVGGIVSLGIRTEDAFVVFEIQNPTVMEQAVAAQLFNRRVSSKGDGRGLGLYAVQVLGEHLLGGVVTFTSSAAEGTRFRFTLPSRAP